MEYILAIIAAVPSVAGLIYNIVKDKHANRSALNRSVGFLLLRALKHDAADSIKRGYISPAELEALEEQYSLYREMGGNGFADALVNQCRKLPMRGENYEK